MQNVGQFGPGAASGHPPSQFVPPEPSPNGGSTTSSLRQFRKKDVDKSHIEQQPPKQMSESHVARVAPHNHYPPGSADAYRYPTPQFSGYNPQVKYSDLAETSQPNPISTSVIQKPKPKDYMEMCNVQQQHLNQQYSPENGQYLHKDPVQGYPAGFKPESHFFPKDQHQYQQLPHHPGPKFNTIMTQNMRKYNPAPADNPFLNKLSKIHPSMARSIISDHHLQDAQPGYPSMDQRGMYSQQNHRYYPGSIPQPNPYSPGPGYAMNAPHPYSNYPSASCSYPRGTQMSAVPPRYAPMERSMSPGRRGYQEAMHMAHMNYHPMHQKIPSGPAYSPQYRGPEYAQHYQHRRMPQDCFPQACRPAQYMQSHHQIPGQEIQELAEDTVSPSDSLKKFIENWADEEPSGEINTMEANMNLREKLRDDAPAGTVYMINANDVQYFENNGIPIVTSDNGGFQLTSEYLVKNGLVDNNGVVRIIEANKDISPDSTGAQERVVNLQIMEAPKADCMMATKHLRPNEALIQKTILSKPEEEKEDRRVVIHQNTILNPGNVLVNDRIPQESLDQIPPHQSVVDSISITKELVDKNCSPINLDHFDHNLGFSEPDPPETENEKSLETCSESIKISDSQTSPSDNQTFSGAREDLSQNPDTSPGNKSMPIIDFFGDASALNSGQSDGNEVQDSNALAENANSAADDNSELNQDEIKVEQDDCTEPVSEPKDSENNLDKGDVVSSYSVATEVKSEPLTSEAENKLGSDQIDEVAQPNREIAIENCEHEGGALSPEIDDTEVVQAPVDRKRRIFSVDDIMGINNNKKSSREADNTSFAALINFIQKETEFSSLEQISDPKISLKICKDDKRQQNGAQIQADSEEVKMEKTEEPQPICRCTNAPSLRPVQDSEAQTNTSYSRDALKVEGNSVLLQVAGELMEIRVSAVDGRNVINVTPLSDSTAAVVDYNDNYSTFLVKESCSKGPADESERSGESQSKTSISDNADNQIETNVELQQGSLSDKNGESDVNEEALPSSENVVSGISFTEKNNNEDVFINQVDTNSEVIGENMTRTDQTVEDTGEICCKESDDLVLDAPKESAIPHSSSAETTHAQIDCPNETIQPHEDGPFDEENPPDNDHLDEETVISEQEPKHDTSESPEEGCSENNELSELEEVLNNNDVERHDENNDLIEPAEEEVAPEAAAANIAEESGVFSECDMKKAEIVSLSNAVVETNLEYDIKGVDDVPERISDRSDATSVDGGDFPDSAIGSDTINTQSRTLPETLSEAEESEAKVDNATESTDANLNNNEKIDDEPSEVTDEAQDNLENIITLENAYEDAGETTDCAEESLDFPLEDEVFIAEPPAHEVIVTDPLEGLGVIEERGIMSDSPEIPLEPVTTTAEIVVNDPEQVTGSLTASKISDVTVVMVDANLKTAQDNFELKTCQISAGSEIDEPVKKNIEPEIQILSPTSTNVEDPMGIPKSIVYLGPNRKYSTDNEISEYATSASVIATKAAKKLYESDLQVQHDIVSSSKKEDAPKQVNKNKKSVIKRSKRLNEKVQLKSEQKEILKHLAEKRKRREELRQKEKYHRINPENIGVNESLEKDQPVEHDEEYVDFKELLLARKLKKLKKLEESKESNKSRRNDHNTDLKQRASFVSSSHARDKKVEKQNDCCIGCNSSAAKRLKTDKHRDGKEAKDCRKTRKEIESLDTTKTTISPALLLKPEPVQIVPPHTESTSQRTEKVKPDKGVHFSDDCPSSTSGTSAKKCIPTDHMLHPKDPRRKSKVFLSQVMVPSVSELIEENQGPISKKKISLADYVSRKRKATCTDDGPNKTHQDSDKRLKLDSSGYERTDSTDSANDESTIGASKTKTLNDVKTSFVIHSSDWEDSSSPAAPLQPTEEDCLIQDFSGLIKSNPKKPVIDVNELTSLDNPKDRTLQEYKDKIDSQLSSLNIHIPKSKPHRSDIKSGKLSLGPHRSPKSASLVKRFLNNEKLSQSEMDNIRKIISYKRSIQHQKNGKSPSKSSNDKSPASSSCTESSLAPTCDVKNYSRLETDPKEMKLHFKKVNAKRKLQIAGDEEGSSSVVMANQSDTPKKHVGYSVFNRLGEDGQPKIILKRNKRSSLIKQPVVELVKLDLDDLEKVKEKYNVTVRRTM